MDMGIWVIVLTVIAFMLFVVGCVLYDSQRDAEMYELGGFKLIVNLDWGTAKHTSITYHDTLLQAQTSLNSYSFPQIVSAHALHTGTGLRYVMNYNGVLKSSKKADLYV